MSEEHPAQVAYRDAVARPSMSIPTDDDRDPMSSDLRLPAPEVARAYALLADPGSVRAKDSRASLAPALTIVRDAMLANPEMIAGRVTASTRR